MTDENPDEIEQLANYARFQFQLCDRNAVCRRGPYLALRTGYRSLEIVRIDPSFEPLRKTWL